MARAFVLRFGLSARVYKSTTSPTYTNSTTTHSSSSTCTQFSTCDLEFMDKHPPSSAGSGVPTSGACAAHDIKTVDTKTEDLDKMTATNPACEHVESEFKAESCSQSEGGVSVSDTSEWDIIIPAYERLGLETEPAKRSDEAFQTPDYSPNGPIVPGQPRKPNFSAENELSDSHGHHDTAEDPRLFELRRVFGPRLEQKSLGKIRHLLSTPFMGKEKHELTGSEEVLEAIQEVNTNPPTYTLTETDTSTVDAGDSSKDEGQLSEEELERLRTEALEKRFQELQVQLRQAKLKLKEEEAKLKEAEKAEQEARQKLQRAKAPLWKVRDRKR
ncbi:hypothetical protein DM02DRAFT_654493 [Periconia macrospinosa]|uniref:Uncharacterized protein n=1 Tax=Periconia macrospinosa TaxID=97972 RepID=A0A2V1DU50_9PLEO|nr:hypothetical protein DM02DRAFT_654493 [Periconia macrospinosa]